MKKRGREADFDFYGRILSGRKSQKPVKRAISTVNGTLGDALGGSMQRDIFAEARSV